MTGEPLDIAVRGREIKRHFQVDISVDAAAAIRRVMTDFRDHCRKDIAFFGLREDEDEALSALVSALQPEDGEDQDPDGGVLVG